MQKAHELPPHSDLYAKRFAVDPAVRAHIKQAEKLCRDGLLSEGMKEFYYKHDKDGKPIDDLPRGVGCSSLLEAQETTSSDDSKHTYRDQFMQGNESEYDATIEALTRLDTSEALGRIYALDNCRRFAYFARDNISGDVRIMTDSCRQRWCPMCAGQKAKYAKESAQRYIEGLERPRFLTLTLKNEPSDLKTQIDFLQECFKRLRQRVYWKSNVTGGIWFLQVKRGKNSGYWHPHLHILLDGNYLEQKRMSKLWEMVTFGSPVIYIKQIHDLEYAAKYVARYSARPAYLDDMPVDDRIEVMTTLHGKRLSGTFGNAKTVTLTPPKISDDHEWTRLGWYNQIVNEIDSVKSALAIVNAWKNNNALAECDALDYTRRHKQEELDFKIPDRDPQYYLDFFNTS